LELKYKSLTKRRRPHFQPLDATLFVTFRLVDSIPKSTVRHYKAKRDWLRDQLRQCETIVSDDGSSQKTKWLTDIEKLYREWFIKSEEIMHRHLVGPTWLLDEAVADNVAENLHRRDNDLYRLDAFSIMSNHVHTIFKPLVDESVFQEIVRSADYEDQIPALAKIMQAIKGRSARECNLLLGRSGQFWEHESFDHVIRVGKFEKTLRYILNNPVTAGIVRRWQDYRWNYCRKEWLERFEFD
jgi:REP element-mobilizing transposase RayT